MLKVIRNMRDLNFGALKDVYADNEEILGKHNATAEERIIAEQTFYQYLHEVFFRDPCSFYAVWNFDGRYLAALRLEPYRDGLLITALETAPGARQKGYASSLLAAALQEVKDQKVYAHVKKNNHISLHVHKKCGFLVVSDSAVMLDGSVTSSYSTLCYNPK